MVVCARWTMDIGLDISVVEHMTSDARVLGSIPRPAIYYHLYLFVYPYETERRNRHGTGTAKTRLGQGTRMGF